MKTIISSTEKYTNVKFEGDIYDNLLMMSAEALIRDIKIMTGHSHKNILMSLGLALDVDLREENPTMRASISEATAAGED